MGLVEQRKPFPVLLAAQHGQIHGKQTNRLLFRKKSWSCRYHDWEPRGVSPFVEKAGFGWNGFIIP